MESIAFMVSTVRYHRCYVVAPGSGEYLRKAGVGFVFSHVLKGEDEKQ